MPYRYERETDRGARLGHSVCSVTLQSLPRMCSKLSLSGSSFSLGLCANLPERFGFLHAAERHQLCSHYRYTSTRMPCLPSRTISRPRCITKPWQTSSSAAGSARMIARSHWITEVCVEFELIVEANSSHESGIASSRRRSIRLKRSPCFTSFQKAPSTPLRQSAVICAADSARTGPFHNGPS